MFGDAFDRAGCTFYCVVRDPIDTLASWYRYRCRRALKAGTGPARHANYCGDLSFAEFAADWAENRSARCRVPVSVDFCVGPDGALAPVTFIPYSRLGDLRLRLCRHVGADVTVARRNVSAKAGLRARAQQVAGLIGVSGRPVKGQPEQIDRDALMAYPKMQNAYDLYARIPFAAPLDTGSGAAV